MAVNVLEYRNVLETMSFYDPLAKSVDGLEFFLSIACSIFNQLPLNRLRHESPSLRIPILSASAKFNSRDVARSII